MLARKPTSVSGETHRAGSSNHACGMDKASLKPYADNQDLLEWTFVDLPEKQNQDEANEWTVVDHPPSHDLLWTIELLLQPKPWPIFMYLGVKPLSPRGRLSDFVFHYFDKDHAIDFEGDVEKHCKANKPLSSFLQFLSCLTNNYKVQIPDIELLKVAYACNANQHHYWDFTEFLIVVPFTRAPMAFQLFQRKRDTEIHTSKISFQSLCELLGIRREPWMI